MDAVGSNLGGSRKWGAGFQAGRPDRMKLHQKHCALALVMAGLVPGLALLSPTRALAQGPLSIFQRNKKPEDTTSVDRPAVRLFFTSTPWNKVLTKLADDTGSVLVADNFPMGRYSRRDLRKHSRSQAVRIVNEDLQQHGFRLLEKGQHLVLIDLKARAAEYQRQVVESVDAGPQPRAAVTDIGADGRQRYYQQSAATIQPRRARADSQVRQTGFQAETESPETPAAAPSPQETSGKSKRVAYSPEKRTTRSLMSVIFSAFRDRARSVEQGPGGLPGIEVLSAADPMGRRSILFAISADETTGEMLIEGDEIQVGRIARLLQKLDVAPTRPDEATRVVTTEKGAGDVARQLNPAVSRLVAQNGQPRGDAGNPEAAVQPVGPDVMPDLEGGIRGDVSIEAMEELGVLILKGNSPDVDAVMEIIRQIEELSAQTAPDIHVRMLENVDSNALAELLTSVYTQLNQARGRTTQQGAQISVIAVGRPNAVLILAPAGDLESVLTLIDQLDTPIKPQTSYAVFKLKHTIASQVEQLMEDFYDDRGGLETRARVATDARSNALVVLAKPNDLREIAQLIKKLDTNESGAVAEVRVVELRHSAAEELATVVNQVIQSVLNPPQLGQGQLGQAFLGFGGGNASQALRDVRSAVLEYLVTEDGAERRYRSGILADIRINGDPRSNTIIITAPAESLDLVEQVVRRLDRPSSTVASIKHFMLKNADASSVADLLNELFGDQTTQGGTQVGVQLAGAESSASIVPLRFSTDVRTNSIVAVGPAEALEVIEALLYRLDESDIRDRQTTIIRLKNAPAADIATAIDGFLSQQTQLLQSAGNELISPFEFIEREVIVQAEAYTNSLLISATPRYFEQIREMVLTLDQELPQVVIQALLVEVQLEDIDEFGVELGAQDPILFGRGDQSVANMATGVTEIVPGFNFNRTDAGSFPNTNAVRPEVVAGQALSNFMVGRTSSAAGFGGLVLSASSEYVNVLLRALASCRKVEILSRPQIRTLDNRPALIRMVREQPRVNGFTGGGINALVPTVEIAEAGLILTVTPTISPDGNILLSVTAEKSAFDNTAQAGVITDGQGNAIQTTVKDVTQAETTVVVADEQTIVLGGLIQKTNDDLRRGVPWLSDLPVIGQAFGFDSSTERRTELLIFLTPRIVKGASYGEMLKQIEADRLHFTEWSAEQVHGPLYGIPDPSETYKGPDTWKMMNPTPMPEPMPALSPTGEAPGPAPAPEAEAGGNAASSWTPRYRPSQRQRPGQFRVSGLDPQAMR